MVRITETLIRKRAEHNNLEISTLEEVSLHQLDIERIEYIDKWCRELKILYLQSNLIPRIENVSRLKKLEYLNLALNNVETIENLEGCESLQKLDLTVNFVGELTSIEILRDLPHFNELYLTGNPCTDYEYYREYAIATLPNLKRLDGTEVGKSERIVAHQDYERKRQRVIEQQNEYRKKREREKEEAEEKKDKEKSRKEGKPGFDGRWYTDMNKPKNKIEEIKDEEKENEEFWNEKVPFTPESRHEVHEHMKEQRKREEGNKEEEKEKKPRKLVTDDGRIMNINEAKIDFTLTDDEENNVITLDLEVYKHLDSSLIDVDVQPSHVKATIKGKIFQITLPVEVNADSSKAQRSQITGHLLLTMPKANPVLRKKITKQNNGEELKQQTKDNVAKEKGKSNYLEVDPSVQKTVDLTDIDKKIVPPLGHKQRVQKQERPNSEDFVDDPDVPPLI